jgi:hypothetical protein
MNYPKRIFLIKMVLAGPGSQDLEFNQTGI